MGRCLEDVLGKGGEKGGQDFLGWNKVVLTRRGGYRLGFFGNCWQGAPACKKDESCCPLRNLNNETTTCTGNESCCCLRNLNNEITTCAVSEHLPLHFKNEEIWSTKYKFKITMCTNNESSCPLRDLNNEITTCTGSEHFPKHFKNEVIWSLKCKFKRYL